MKTTVLLVAINSGLSIEGTPPSIALGVAYSYTLKAHGGSGGYAFNRSGSLPSGITFTDNGDGTATIAGTTTAAGRYPITVTLTTGSGTFPNVATYNYTLDVPPVTGQILIYDAITRGIPVSNVLVVSHGGSGGYTYSSSTLPAGLSIGSTTGVISGVVTAPLGSYAVTVNITDSNGNTGTCDANLIVKSRMYFTDAIPPDCEDGLPYQFTFRVSFNWTGTLSLTITDGALPPSLVMDSMGNVSGTPQAGGAIGGHPYTFTLTAHDSGLNESISTVATISDYYPLSYPV
jgi:hypothetical protein